MRHGFLQHVSVWYRTVQWTDHQSFMMAVGSTLRGLYVLLISLSLLTTLCAADAVSDLQKKGRAAVDAAVAKSTTCTKDKLQIRKEW